MENANLKTENSINAKLKKGREGWEASCIIENLNGYDWQIMCYKSGSVIKVSAQAGRITKAGSFSFIMFSDLNITLLKVKKRGTKNAISETFKLGVAVFFEKKEMDELPKIEKQETLKPGDVVSYGDMANSRTRKVVTAETDYYNDFVCYNLDGSGKSSVSMKKIAGLGGWEKEDGHKTAEEIEEIIAKYQANQEKERLEREKAANELQLKIEAGKKLVTIPDWAKSVIVAEFKENTSDLYTDYYAHKSTKYVVLAWSKHNKDLFSEMRKAATRYYETEFLADAPENFEKKTKIFNGRWLLVRRTFA